jgi:hypothetical protein
MRKVYNLLTNKTSITPHTQILQDNDLVLYEEFKSSMAERRAYSEVREEVIKKLVDIRAEKLGKPNTRSVVDKFTKLNDDYFKSNSSNLSDEICVQLCDTYVYNDITSFTAPHQYLLDYMTQVISRMEIIDYKFLIEITNSWKELVFFALQPVFIGVLGIKNYVLQVEYLISGNNLTKLFLIAKQKTTKLHIYQLLPDFTSMPVKNILAISTIFIAPILYACYKTIYPSVAMIESKESMKVNIPKINSPSFKNEYSKSLKEFGSFMHNLGGEIGDIIAQFTSGLGLGYAGRAQQNMGHLFEDSNPDLKSDEDHK